VWRLEDSSNGGMLSARAEFAVIVEKIWSERAKRRGFNMNDGIYILYRAPLPLASCFLLHQVIIIFRYENMCLFGIVNDEG